MRGYFEVVIKEENGENVEGVIKDVCGDARFEGKITDKEINFVKTYTQPIGFFLGLH